MCTFLATPQLFFQTGNCLLCTGRDRAALRRPLVYRTHQPVFHHASLQKRPDQLPQPLVADSLRDLSHQSIMIHPIEKFLQIEVHYEPITFGDVLLCLFHRLMR